MVSKDVHTCIIIVFSVKLTFFKQYKPNVLYGANIDTSKQQ